ncbi:Uncharacterized protein QTN25_005307 [Entamoeba marina]
MSAPVSFNKTINANLVDFNDKLCSKLCADKELLNTLYKALLSGCLDDNFGSEIYDLSNNKKALPFVRLLIPALIYRYLTQQSPQIGAVLIHLFNMGIATTKQVEYTFPQNPNASVFIKPKPKPKTAKLTKQNLSVLEEIVEKNELDLKLHRIASMKLSVEDIDMLTAFLIRNFSKVLVGSEPFIAELYLNTMELLISKYDESNQSLTNSFSIEIILSLSFLIDMDHSVTLCTKVISQLEMFAEKTVNAKMLLLLTQYSEYLKLHKK